MSQHQLVQLWPKIHSHRSHGACTQLACLGHSASTCSPTCHNCPELSWIAATKRKWARLRSSCCYSRMPRLWETPQQEAWCHVVSVSETPLSYFDVWPWPMVPPTSSSPSHLWIWQARYLGRGRFSPAVEGTVSWLCERPRRTQHHGQDSVIWITWHFLGQL
jgi:hypothetical protein